MQIQRLECSDFSRFRGDVLFFFSSICFQASKLQINVYSIENNFDFRTIYPSSTALNQTSFSFNYRKQQKPKGDAFPLMKTLQSLCGLESDNYFMNKFITAWLTVYILPVRRLDQTQVLIHFNTYSSKTKTCSVKREVSLSSCLPHQLTNLL